MKIAGVVLICFGLFFIISNIWFAIESKNLIDNPEMVEGTITVSGVTQSIPFYASVSEDVFVVYAFMIGLGILLVIVGLLLSIDVKGKPLEDRKNL